jgi:hypothetical protein
VQPRPGDAAAVLWRDDVSPDTCASGDGLDMNLDMAVDAIRSYKERTLAA